MVPQAAVAAAAAAAAMTASNMGATPQGVAAAAAAAVHECFRWFAPCSATVVSLIERDVLTEPEAEGMALLAEELQRPPESFKDGLCASLAGHKEELHGGLSGLLEEHTAALQNFFEGHPAHLADYKEAQSVDFDCHRRETSAALDSLRAELASLCEVHKEHFAGHLESHRQEHSAVLHGFRAELVAQLAEQLAAVSALALRQAAQEGAAAAQLERCAALERGLQAALEAHTANLQSFKVDLNTSLAGHKVETGAFLQAFAEGHHARLAEHKEAQSAVLDNFRAELASHSGEHKEHIAGHLESHRQEHSAVLHGFRAELEAQLAQQFAAVSALALRQAAQEDFAAAQLERCAALVKTSEEGDRTASCEANPAAVDLHFDSDPLADLPTANLLVLIEVGTEALLGVDPSSEEVAKQLSQTLQRARAVVASRSPTGSVELTAAELPRPPEAARSRHARRRCRG